MSWAPFLGRRIRARPGVRQVDKEPGLPLSRHGSLRSPEQSGISRSVMSWIVGSQSRWLVSVLGWACSMRLALQLEQGQQARDVKKRA